MRARAIIAAIYLLSLTGCAHGGREDAAELRMVPGGTIGGDVLFRSEAAPMSVHPSCQAISDAEGFETIGAFVSALLARQTEGGANWTGVWVAAENGRNEKLWRVTVTFRGSLKEPGLDFLIRPSTGRVIPDSFTCRAG